MTLRQILLAGMLLLCMLVLAPESSAQLLGNRSAPTEAAAPVWLPGPLRDALSWIVVQQAQFSRALRGAVTAYRDGHSMLALYSLVGLSFLYGVFHAAGPGHGKAVVASYFMARDSQLRRGLALGCLIAGIQALTAITIVATLGWVLDFSRVALLDSMPVVEAISYCLIILLGIWMTWSALTGRDCGHDHTGLGHSHDSHSDHDHDHQHTHAETAPQRFEFLGAAIVSGLRPCTGALIVLLFALANGIFLVGALSALAMGVGVALTVSMVGIAVILSRRGLLRITGQGGSASSLARWLSIAGSLLVCLIGAALLFGISANWQEAVYRLGRFA